MKKKNHQKARSLHTIQEISNSKTYFIARQTQKGILKSFLTPLPIIQAQQIQVPAPLSGRVVARKVINTNHLKTQPSSHEIDMKQSIFKLIASPEFKNIITEEKQKKEEDLHFTLDGPLMFKQKTQNKIFKQQIRIKQSFYAEEDQTNIEIFLKKIRQIMTTSHISHEDNHTNENSFLSDKFKTQLTSPRFTFTNHLSTIQFQNQQTQIQKGQTVVAAMLDAIEEKKEPLPSPNQPIRSSRKKLTITVCTPENQVGVLQFSVPTYEEKKESEPASPEQTDDFNQYAGKPKHVLKQALQFISSQPKKSSTKFSKSILKLVGITDENDENEDAHQYFNLQKTRRFLKMYLQSKVSRIFIKLEETILLQLLLISEKRTTILNKVPESQQSSRLYSWCTNPANSNHESYSNPTFETLIEPYKFLNEFKKNYFDYSLNEEDQDYSLTIQKSQFNNSHIQCCSSIQIKNLKYLQFIINELDGETRNSLLQDEDHDIDVSMFRQQLDRNKDSQLQKNINHLLGFLKKKDRIFWAQKKFKYFNNILTGFFEDDQEIVNLTTDYGLEEYQEEPRSSIKIDIAKLFIKAAKPTKPKHSSSNLDQSPYDDRNNEKKKSAKINLSPRHQTLYQTTNQHPNLAASQISTGSNKQVKQLLEATSSQPNVLRRRSDSPQEDVSIKEMSNTNTTQSNKMKNTQTIQNTTVPTSQKDVEKQEDDKPQERRGGILMSMTKYALQMRTQINEARRRQSIPIHETVKLLIEEQKLAELEELFLNNPNIQVNVKLKNGGDTFLMLSAQTGHIEIVQFLLHKGASVNIQNDHGDTCLHRAISYGHFEVADLLQQYGAQNLRNFEGLTPWQLQK